MMAGGDVSPRRVGVRAKASRGTTKTWGVGGVGGCLQRWGGGGTLWFRHCGCTGLLCHTQQYPSTPPEEHGTPRPRRAVWCVPPPPPRPHTCVRWGTPTPLPKGTLAPHIPPAHRVLLPLPPPLQTQERELRKWLSPAKVLSMELMSPTAMLAPPGAGNRRPPVGLGGPGRSVELSASSTMAAKSR